MNRARSRSDWILLTLLAGFGLLGSGLAGCAHSGSLGRRPPAQACPHTCPEELATTAPARHLPLVPLDQRPAIVLPNTTRPLMGRPLGLGDQSQVRPLTIEQCERWAGDAAPLARELEAHRAWLAKFKRTPGTLLQAMDHQADYERSRHQLTALEAYLNLCNVYAQTTVLDHSQEFLDQLEEALDRFRQAQIDVNLDPGQLDRRRWQFQEQEAELLYNQRRLVAGLEVLIHASVQPQHPIWTAWDGSSCALPPDEETAIAQALDRRGDLLALQTLAGDSQVWSQPPPGALGAAAAGSASGLSIPQLPAWWMCRLREEIDCLQQAEAQQRGRQLQRLVENKRNQIRLEVQEIWHSLEHQQTRLELQTRQRESLRQSLEVTRRMKDQRPVAMEDYIRQVAEEFEATSQIIQRIIDIEIDRRRLAHAVGSL